MTRKLILLCLAALLLAACKPDKDSATGSSPAAPPAPAAKGAPAESSTASPDIGPDASSASEGEGDKPDMPALKVNTLDGKPYDLAGHRGKWVVVNFWATWCGPCRKEMPELSALDAMREQIEVIGLAYEDISVADMQAFLTSHPVVYPIAIVDVMDPPADFETPRGLPMTYLIDPTGKVAKRFLGPVTATEIEAVVNAGGGAKTG